MKQLKSFTYDEIKLNSVVLLKFTNINHCDKYFISGYTRDVACVNLSPVKFICKEHYLRCDCSGFIKLADLKEEFTELYLLESEEEIAMYELGAKLI